MTTDYYLALDIEGRGNSLDNPICAIGVYLAPKDPRLIGTPGVLVVKRRWALKALPGQVDEKRCMDEFWSKFPEVDKWIRANERPALLVMQEFRDWCKAQAEAVGLKRITLLTDCPDYDAGRLDELGHRTGTWTFPTRFLGTTTRHYMSDPGERMEQIGAEDAFKAWLADLHPDVQHSHYPDDDAQYNYWQMIYCDAHKKA